MSLQTSVLTGAKQIPLSGGKAYAAVDAEDFKYLSQWAWKLQHGRAVRTKHVGTVGYWRNGKRKDIAIFMHREIMDVSENKEVDHKDNNPLNNRKSNLRVCTHAQNRANSKLYANSKTGFKGVTLDKENKKYLATIRFMGKTYNLGRFNDATEAALEYDNVAVQLHGEYAKLNFGGNNVITN